MNSFQDITLPPPFEEVIEQPLPDHGPVARTNFIKLPQTDLYYSESGEGPPLIIVPATMSRLEHWIPLARFMGQHFKTYFFELPGHGRSKPFTETFSSHLVAEMVESFADSLGLQTFSLMGFSFGGILSMESLSYLEDRIESVFLFAPVVTTRAISLSAPRRFAFKCFTHVMQKPGVQRKFLEIVQGGWLADLIWLLLKKVGKIEDSITQEKVFGSLKLSTVEVMSRQLGELLCFEPPARDHPFGQICYFAMSVNDPLVDYSITRDELSKLFARVRSVEFYYPWHQPEELPTFESLNADFGEYLSLIE